MEEGREGGKKGGRDKVNQNLCSAEHAERERERERGRGRGRERERESHRHIHTHKHGGAVGERLYPYA